MGPALNRRIAHPTQLGAFSAANRGGKTTDSERHLGRGTRGTARQTGDFARAWCAAVRQLGGCQRGRPFLQGRPHGDPWQPGGCVRRPGSARPRLSQRAAGSAWAEWCGQPGACRSNVGCPCRIATVVRRPTERFRTVLVVVRALAGGSPRARARREPIEASRRRADRPDAAQPTPGPRSQADVDRAAVEIASGGVRADAATGVDPVCVAEAGDEVDRLALGEVQIEVLARAVYAVVDQN